MGLNRLLLANLRKEYSEHVLIESQAARNPINQFEKWLLDAVHSKLREPHAMCLATVGKDKQPSARMVLLKEFSSRGFTFASSYRSQKALQLKQNSAAAIVFYWADLERQIRIEGSIQKTSRIESRKLFSARPNGSQLAAVASRQSSTIESRAELENNYHKLKLIFDGKPIPPPTDWGGYRLVPKRIEFWQGRKNRLHDRLLYSKNRQGRWTISRLAP